MTDTETQDTSTEQKNDHKVVVRHALFRYHIVGQSATGTPDTQILHAERGAEIEVNDQDFNRGVKYGAFYMGQPEASIRSAMGGLQTLEERIQESMGTESDPSRGDAEINLNDLDDDELNDYMQRHDPDEIIVKTQGTDDALIKRVLAMEYQITDGDPRPEVKNVLVDLLGENPEEDESGEWVNEPEVEEDSPVAEQRKARRAAGTKKTSRSTKGEPGA